MENCIRQREYDQTIVSFEPETKESVTIPNQSLTIREILVRFKAGILPDIGKTPQFDGNDDFDAVNPTERPDFDMADATEILSGANRLAEEIKNTQQLNEETSTEEEVEQSGTTTEEK